MPPVPGARRLLAPAVEDIPGALHQAEIDRLQAAHNVAMAALCELVNQLRDVFTAERARSDNQLVEQQARHDAETARQLAERDTLHLGYMERLAAQAAAERALWLERIDAAECRTEAAETRAERIEEKLDKVLDQLLSERSRPWWRRWW